MDAIMLGKETDALKDTLFNPLGFEQSLMVTKASDKAKLGDVYMHSHVSSCIVFLQVLRVRCTLSVVTTCGRCPVLATTPPS